MSGRVTRISIAPVKSLGLVHPEEIEIGPRGVAGNRRFWLVDEEGRLFNNKRCGPLVRIRPEWDEGSRTLALTLPDGERVEGVVELGEAVVADLWGHPSPSHRVIGPWEAAIARVAGRPVTLLWADDHATDRGFRGGDISLVSVASLERLREEGDVDGPIDGRRFRLLLEIDGVRAHEEDEWLGTRVQVGEAVLVLNGDIGRCVVTTQDPDTGVTDLDTLGTLARYRREGRNEPLPFGVYGAVAVPGRVRVGDPVLPLERSLLAAG
ncbi:MAG TPA: MOSC N-terminal beta barrel domain-containing protein [Gaiellaceae bacterium]